MFFAYFHIRRHFLQTDLHAMLTARCKRTAFRRIQHIDRRTFDRDQSFIALCIYTRHGAQKSFCIWMCRFVENIINRSLFYDTSCIHNGNFITDICDNTQVMSDKDDSHLCLFCRSFIRSRICAWIVTSRAVVGSSAIRSCG